MTDTTPKPQRRWARYLLGFFLLLVVLAGGLAWYMRTESFRTMVRSRLIQELERITGGHVELGAFHIVPFRRRVEALDLTIHGREAANEIPFAHADRITAQFSLTVLLNLQIGFRSVELERPVIHIIEYADRTTNAPDPRRSNPSVQTPVEQLFALRISRLQVRRGEILVNNQRMPLDFVANDVDVSMQYLFFHRYYEGEVVLGKVDTTLPGLRPLAWTAHTQFQLSREHLNLKTLSVVSGRSSLDFRGALTDFKQPALSGEYHIKLDGPEWGAITRRPELSGGSATLEGKGEWSAASFSSQGVLAIRELDWKQDGLNLRDAALNAKFDLTPQRIRLAEIKARVAGGEASGDADWMNWQNSLSAAPRNTKMSALAVQRGLVRLKVEGFSVLNVLQALDSKALPLSPLRLNGTARGTAEVSWIGTYHNTETKLNLALTPPPHPAAHQLPVNAQIEATYRAAHDELQVDRLELSTPGTQVHAKGTLSSSLSLNFTVASTNLTELGPEIAALQPGGSFPITLHGRAGFEGSATGKPSAPEIVGHLDAQDFDLLLPGTARRPEQVLQGNSVTANLQISPTALVVKNAIWNHQDTEVQFSGNAGLRHYLVRQDDAYSAHLDARNADVAEILALAGYSIPITGKANLTATLGGTLSEPYGDGILLLTQGGAYGQTVSALSSAVHLANHEFQFDTLQLSSRAAHISGGGAYNFQTDGFRFDLSGTDFDLAQVLPLQKSPVAVTGTADFRAKGSGTIAAPIIEAHLMLRDLTLDNEKAGAFVFDVNTHGADAQITGHSQFEKSELEITGSIHLRDEFPADLKLRFGELDVDSLLRVYLSQRVTGHALVAGEVTVQGPLRRPRDLHVLASLDHVHASLENVEVENAGPLEVAMQDEVATIRQFHLKGNDTDFSAHGNVRLAEPGEVDVHLDGQVSLKLLEAYDPALTTAGLVQLAVGVSGTLHDPVLQGTLKVERGSVFYGDLPSGLSDIQGSLRFDRTFLKVETLTARTGGGMVNITGSAINTRGQFVLDFTLTQRDVRLRYPPGVSSTSDADLRLSGTNLAPLISGDVTVNKLSITPGFDFSAYGNRLRVVSPPSPEALSSRVRLDVHILTAPELRAEMALAKLSGDADLHLRGILARPAVLGRVDILEGDIYFNSRKYKLERGDVLFSNPVHIEPVLDLQATTRVGDYDITLNLNGSLDKPNGLQLNYRSEPPLADDDIIALLALGRTREESQALSGSSTTSAFSGEASNLILSEAINATVSNRVQKLFGVSRIKVDPQGLATSTTSTSAGRGAQLTIEQQVANNLTLTYSQNVAIASQQVIQAEYNVTRNISIVALRDQNGVVSFDIKIRQRKK